MANPLAQVGGRIAQLRATPEAKATGGALWGALVGIKPALIAALVCAIFISPAAVGIVFLGTLGGFAVHEAWKNARPAVEAQRHEAQDRRAEAEAEAALAARDMQPQQAQEQGRQAAPSLTAAPASPESHIPGPHAQAELARRQAARGPRIPG